MKPRLGVLWVVAACCFAGIDGQALAAGELPLTHVTLFTSGVGFFEREGEVTGDTSVTLSFRTGQINDLLKSMVLQDFGGGRIAPVVFGSPEPVEHTLKTFAVDLSDNPPLAQLLNRMRGAKLEVAAPKEIQGVIVGVETQHQKVKDEVVEIHVLNLLTDEGLRAVPLDQVQAIKLLDAPLEGDLRGALSVLAGSHDSQRKPVLLNFTGQGKRRVSVGYVLESPVWRASYRLELQDKKPAFLQGWGIVENRTDDDWKAVNLTLVSGRPISFIMDLYQPLFVPRPTVTPETFASLRPPVYGSGSEGGKETEALLREQAAPMEKARRFGLAAAPAAALAAGVEARQAEVALANRGVAPMAEAGAVGELFQYAIEQPVSVARHDSAMLPIVNAPIEAHKVSIYNESVQPRFPLSGLRMTNTTGLVLMQGPITVFDGGTYAGDARIEDLQPKEQRLVSYALDLKVQVEARQQGETNELTSIQIRKGVLLSTRRFLQTKLYTIHNQAVEKRLVLIEHPVHSDWKLIEPRKPVERTPSVYRFQVAVDPGQRQQLEVREEKLVSESVGLVNAGLDLMSLYSKAGTISPKVRAALEKVVSVRTALADLQRHESQVQQQITDITTEQTRIRDNMKVLQQTSDLYNRYLRELDQQETQIGQLRDQLQKLRADEETQRKQLDDYVNGLEVG